MAIKEREGGRGGQVPRPMFSLGGGAVDMRTVPVDSSAAVRCKSFWSSSEFTPGGRVGPLTREAERVTLAQQSPCRCAREEHPPAPL